MSPQSENLQGNSVCHQIVQSKLAVHLSETDWKITKGAPCLGEHTDDVLKRLLDYSDKEISQFHNEGVV